MPARRTESTGALGASGPPQQSEAGRSLRRDARENRRRVLEAAARVFAIHGLDAPVEEIAKAAGVGMGTVYRRFPNKEALIEELVSEFFESVVDAARQAMQATDGSGFETLLRQTVALQASHGGCVSRLWQTPAKETRAAEFDDLLDQLLKEAKTAGRIRVDCTPADVMMVFWAARGIIEAGTQVAPGAWQRYLDITLAGLRPDAAALASPPLTSGEEATKTGAAPGGSTERL